MEKMTQMRIELKRVAYCVLRQVFGDEEPLMVNVMRDESALNFEFSDGSFPDRISVRWKPKLKI
jgi:hypothetical protein